MTRALLILIFLFALPALAMSPCDELLSARVQLQKKWVGGKISESIYRLENKILDEKGKQMGVSKAKAIPTATASKAKAAPNQAAKLAYIEKKEIVPIDSDHFKYINENRQGLGINPSVIKVSNDLKHAVIEAFTVNGRHILAVDLETGAHKNFVQSDMFEGDNSFKLWDIASNPEADMLISYIEKGQRRLALARTVQGKSVLSEALTCPSGASAERGNFSANAQRLLLKCSNGTVAVMNVNNHNEVAQLTNDKSEHLMYFESWSGFSAEGDYVFGYRVEEDSHLVDIMSTKDYGHIATIDLSEHKNANDQLMQLHMNGPHLYMMSSSIIKDPYVQKIDIYESEAVDGYHNIKNPGEKGWKENLALKRAYHLKKIEGKADELQLRNLETDELYDFTEVTNEESFEMHATPDGKYLVFIYNTSYITAFEIVEEEIPVGAVQ